MQKRRDRDGKREGGGGRRSLCEILVYDIGDVAWSAFEVRRLANGPYVTHYQLISSPSRVFLIARA